MITKNFLKTEYYVLLCKVYVLTCILSFGPWRNPGLGTWTHQLVGGSKSYAKEYATVPETQILLLSNFLLLISHVLSLRHGPIVPPGLCTLILTWGVVFDAWLLTPLESPDFPDAVCSRGSPSWHCPPNSTPSPIKPHQLLHLHTGGEGGWEQLGLGWVAGKQGIRGQCFTLT